MKPSKIIFYKERAPSLIQKAKNLAESAVKIASSKTILVPKEVEMKRLEICQTACPAGAWDPKGNFGLGKCNLCGCCKFKPKFAAMKCPAGAWDEYITPTTT